MPVSIDPSSDEAQTKIREAVEKALKKQTSDFVVKRLSDIALENDFEYNVVKVKKLKRRWGSCDSKKNIVLSLYLAQLSWELIDYVLVHELVHTQELNHSQNFWKKVESIIPDYKQHKKTLKNHSPEASVF